MNTLDKLDGPLAIAMWDSSWLRRRYRGGGFEDWDKALDELVERGYNALRIDAFPHLIAKSPTGEVVDVYKDPPGQPPHHFGFALWGNQWTIYIEPRKSLIEFLRKCQTRKIKVGLSTWFKPEDSRRNEQIEGLDEFVRVWNETLRFIDDHGLMDTVIYVDLLNEFPLHHCFAWLHRMGATMTQPRPEKGACNARQHEFYWHFLNDAVDALRRHWPEVAFSASSVYGDFRRLTEGRDLSNLDFFDLHMWLNGFDEYISQTEYHTTIWNHGEPDHLYRVEKSGSAYAGQSRRLIPNDYRYDEVYAEMLERWTSDKARWTDLFRERITWVGEQARRFHCHAGQTEAWGLTKWVEHPLLDWQIHRECAEVCLPICTEQGYTFNCTSNFCHPHHLGFWDNPAWHRQCTDVIRQGPRQPLSKS